MYSVFIGYCVFTAVLVERALSMAMLKNFQLPVPGESYDDITQLIKSTGHWPAEKELPKISFKSDGNGDVTYLLSKLTDEELVNLLSKQPQKKEYSINDIIQIASNANDRSYQTDLSKSTEYIKNKKLKGNNLEKPSEPIFRLENKIIEPSSNLEPHYIGIQKLNKLLYSRPVKVNADDKSENEEDDIQKQLRFDALVSQLKTLCCKKHRAPNVEMSTSKLKSLLHNIMPQTDTYLPKTRVPIKSNEKIFLIINDEIKTNNASEDELIYVDPDSLGNNSSAVLLGPITTPLSDAQLKIVMSRISMELSKTEYQPLLQQISDGKLKDDNIKLMNSLISGPETRRYIKPHRCNHQSKLARVFGGLKWIICTGYININEPSLYD